jgi:hypothetical protein
MWTTAMMAANPKHNQKKEHKPHQGNCKQGNGRISNRLQTKEKTLEQRITNNASNKCKQTIEMQL